MNCPKCESPMTHVDTLQNRSFASGERGPATYEYHCAGCDVTDWTNEEPRSDEIEYEVAMNIQTEKAYVGYYATTDDYDGAPDAGFPSNVVGWGETPEEAEADLMEQLHTEDACWFCDAPAVKDDKRCYICGKSQKGRWE